MRILHAAGAIGGLIMLGGCTTLASGVAVAPPGVNKYSFRECLLARGFYSPAALTGIALRDWHYRHRIENAAGPNDTAEETPDRSDLLQQSDSKFVVHAAGIIAGGLLPATEFWDDRVRDQQTPDGPQTPASAQTDINDRAPYAGDARLGAPYVDLSAPQQFPHGRLADGSDEVPGQSQPSIGDPRSRDWRLNRFLDCYIAPVGVQAVSPDIAPDDPAPANAFENGDDDLEGRLLRGHILLSLLASYGMELVISRPGGRQVAQAELLLGHIRDAETALRGSSIVMSPKARAIYGTGLVAIDGDGKSIRLQRGEVTTLISGADGKPTPVNIRQITLVAGADDQPTLRWKSYTTRLLRVFQVGVDIQRIDAQQTLDRASNLVAAFSGQAGSFIDILRDGLSGIVTTQKIRIYGNAYMRDARETLAISRRAASVDAKGQWSYEIPLLAGRWRLWDAELRQACTVLATVAKKEPEAANCVPAIAGGEDAR